MARAQVPILFIYVTRLVYVDYRPMLGTRPPHAPRQAPRRRPAARAHHLPLRPVASAFAFAYALATQGRLDHRNLRPGRGGMSPLRPVAAMARYFFMGCLVVNAWRA